MATVWVLGIDIGKKKTGVAVGQSITGQARPLALLNIPAKTLCAKNFESFIVQWSINCIVIGLPVLADKKPHPLEKVIQRLANDLKQYFKLPVYFADETLTSHEARQRFGVRDEYDSGAAAIMVEDFFASEKLSHLSNN